MEQLLLDRGRGRCKLVEETFRGDLMNATILKWGSSLALRIPSSVVEELRLREGSAVELTVEVGRIVVKPVETRKLSLTQLLKGITKENRHSETDSGAPVGREIW
jgi:antitoxin MazE